MDPKTLAYQLGNTAFVVQANTGDLSNDESLVAPRPAGNCANWVLGHMVASRDKMLGLLGQKPVWDEATAKRYDNGSAPISNGAAGTVPFDRIRAAFQTSQERAMAGLSGADAATLAQKAPFSPTGNPDETIGSLLATLVFHDAYHAGQTAMLRRVVGKAATM